VGRVAVLALIAALLVPASAVAGAPPDAGERREQWRRSLESAEQYARERLGRVSFALVDETGRLRTHGGRRRYSSASVVKAMLLVAYLSRRDVRRHELDFASRANLGPMIRRSGNGAASRIHAVVGSRGLERVARRARMKDFSTSQSWAGTQITAADQARLFARIDMLVPRRHRRYARYLLAHVVESQRWGIPPALPQGSRAYFKGGWRPEEGGWLVHQAALVENGSRRVSIAVLTDHDRSEGYGHESIRGVAKRALRPLARP
jgi:hypothetical protein